jgi:hypothetical protein
MEGNPRVMGRVVSESEGLAIRGSHPEENRVGSLVVPIRISRARPLRVHEPRTASSEEYGRHSVPRR